MTAVGAPYYRIVDRRYSVTIDPDAEIFGSRTEVELQRFTVDKVTPKGVWLRRCGRNGEPYLFVVRRFMLNDAGRRFACPTLDDALVSYRARKTKQARIYQARADEARMCLRLAEEKFGGSLVEVPS